MRTMLSSLKVLQDSQVKEAQLKLMRAGIRSKDWAVGVIFGRMVLPIVFGGIMAFIVYGTSTFDDWSALKRYALVAGTLVLSYKAPDIYLKNAITKRTDAIRKGLPDALDLLVICAEAGLTVDAAFHRVAKELGRAYPELGDEFTLTAIELGFLTERRQAFENLATRVELDAIKGVVTTMIQTEKYGTPLASALRVLSAEFRNERMMRAEEKAARLPAIMTIPLILSSCRRCSSSSSARRPVRSTTPSDGWWGSRTYPSNRHPTVSPARNGTTDVSPSPIRSGTVTVSRTSVTVPSFSGRP